MYSQRRQAAPSDVVSSAANAYKIARNGSTDGVFKTVKSRFIYVVIAVCTYIGSTKQSYFLLLQIIYIPRDKNK